MAELKHYWDNLTPSKNDELSVDYSLDKVLTRINRRRAALGLSIALVSCLAVAVTCLTLLPGLNSSEIQRYYTACGDRQTVVLPDGTSVQMNSGSSIVYPERFSSKHRTVVFSGEGIFSVAKNARHPFIVKAPSFEVEVLGTVFNLEAYPEENKSTVVLSEGSVVIRHSGSESTLRPGQKAELLSGGAVSIVDVAPSDYMTWSKGGFDLHAAGITEIVNLIRRTYAKDVQLSYSSKFDGTRITARSESSRSVEEFLELIAELIPGMEYKISDNTISIY